MKKIKVSEIFSSIQGEGLHTGRPMTFVRLSGCTRECYFCDTKYHTQGKEISIDEVVQKILEADKDIVCWTGGEPLVQREAIKGVINKVPEIEHHIETNGDLLKEEDFGFFHYVSISPKDKKTAERVRELIDIGESLQEIRPEHFDIKVVTDMKDLGVDMLDLATILMPITTENQELNVSIAQEVWKYCVENNMGFSPRLQTYIFNVNKRGV